MFENRIKAKEPANFKFKFLSVDNSYNEYYKFKVNEIKLAPDFCASVRDIL